MNRWLNMRLVAASTLFVIALGAATLMPLDASATIVVRLDVESLTAASDVIATVEVLGQESEYTDDDMRIVTRIDLRVDDPVKGCDDAERLEITMPGGRIGDIAQHVSGVPAFEVGERAIVFLERLPNGELTLTGLGQGKFTLVRPLDGSIELAVPSLDGLTLAEVEPGESRPVVRELDVAPSLGATPAADLIERVRALAAE